MPRSQVIEKPASRSPDKPAEKLPAPIAILKTQLEERAHEFAMVLPSHITPDKLQRTILTAVQSSPVLLDCERRSFLTACMKAAQDGLLPDGREAAIVPFNHSFKDRDGWHTVKLAQYMPMVWGLRKKILQSGEITDIFASVAYRQELDAGRFIYEEGTERTLRHKPILEPDFKPSDEDVALAYSVATYSDGSKSFEVLKRWEIDQIRESSQTGAQFDAKGNPREAKGPWVEWFGEMAKKSAIRRHSKSLPMSGDILADVEAEDMDFAARSAVALLDNNPAPGPQPIADPVPTKAEEDESFDPQTGEVLTESDTRQEPEESRQTEPEPEAEEQPQAEEEAQDRDELGVTIDPMQKAAEAMINRANRCELLIDLRTLEREADMELAEMPPHIAGFVDEAFARARERINSKNAQPKDG